MGVFDVLRYPISDLPTEEELGALPSDLFKKWKSQTVWVEPTYFDTPKDIGRYYTELRPEATAEGKVLEAENTRAIALLRKMIKEYNEPI